MSIGSQWLTLCTFIAGVKVVDEPQKTPGFLASGEELSPGPVTGLDRSELLCNQVLLKCKRDQKASDTDIGRGQKKCQVFTAAIFILANIW